MSKWPSTIILGFLLSISLATTASTLRPTSGIHFHCLLPQFNICGPIPVELIFKPNAFGPRLLTAMDSMTMDSEKVVWQQVRRLLKKRQDQKAISHSANLSEATQNLAQRWITYYDQPIELLTTPFPDTVYAREILHHALKMLARRDLELAIHHFHQVIDRYHFSTQQRQVIQGEIALMLLLQGDDRAENWWRPIPFKAMSPKLQNWLLRDTLRQQDWVSYIARYQALPATTQNHARWLFWLAYAYEKTDQSSRAKEIWQSLVKERHFYALLAHHQLQLPIRLHHRQINHSEQALLRLEKHPKLQLAKQWWQQEKHALARLHWRQAIETFSDEERYMASRIADQWGWHTEAIVTMRKQSYQDDLRLRFPLAHKRHIAPNAEKFGVNPAIMYAIARLESHFRQAAVSPAGALGVMQLMPKTAQQYLKKFTDKRQLIQAVLHLPTNIRIACQHFKSLLKRFAQQPMLAIAAYNAGLGNVQRWLATNKHMPPLVWLELIPYHETREYVKLVITYTAVYHRHLKLKFDLSKFLQLW